VYTHPDFQGTGIGLQLYQILFQLLIMQGYRNVYAGITLPNIASIRLHEKCGFRHFSTYENVGFKLGQWKSVGWWKLQINEYDHEPSPPLKFIEIEPAVFENLFVTASAQILQRMIY